MSRVTRRRRPGSGFDAVALAEQHGARPEVAIWPTRRPRSRCGAHFDMVGPIAVYGLSPVPQHHEPAELGLRPAMTLAARMLLVSSWAGTACRTRTVPATETSLGWSLGYVDGIRATPPTSDRC
jgi:alanine racemase